MKQLFSLYFVKPISNLSLNNFILTHNYVTTFPPPIVSIHKCCSALGPLCFIIEANFALTLKENRAVEKNEQNTIIVLF